MMIETMVEVGISQAMIFAFKGTGRIVTERNKHLLTAEELREWNPQWTSTTAELNQVMSFELHGK